MHNAIKDVVNLVQNYRPNEVKVSKRILVSKIKMQNETMTHLHAEFSEGHQNNSTLFQTAKMKLLRKYH